MNPYMELPRLGRQNQGQYQATQDRLSSGDHLWLSAGIYRAVSAIESMIDPLVDRASRHGRRYRRSSGTP